MQSRFNRSTEGWAVSGDVAAFGWEPRGGSSRGHLAWTDAAAGSVVYYQAPDRFEGGKAAYFGGTLSYDIKVSSGSIFASPDVRVTGANGMTLVATVGTPGTDWTTLSVALDATGGWRIGDADGATASNRQIRRVLKNIEALEIRAEYIDGDENGGLDTVTLLKPGQVFGDDRAMLEPASSGDGASLSPVSNMLLARPTRHAVRRLPVR